MKTALCPLLLILTLLGKSQQNEFLEVDMQFDNGILQSLSTHLVSSIPTQAQQNTENPITIQIPTQILPTIQNVTPTQAPQIFTLPIIPLNISTQENPNENSETEEDSNFSGCVIVPTTSVTPVQEKTTQTSTVQITNTVIETVKVIVPEVEKKREVKEVKIPKKVPKKVKVRKHQRKKRRHHKRETKTKKIKETTEVISLAIVTPTVKINLQEKRETDIDVNEIWKILESDPKPKIKSKAKEKKTCPDIKIKEIKEVKIDSDAVVKKNALEERLKKLENLLLDKQKKEEKKTKAPIKQTVKHNVVAKTKQIGNGPLQIYEKVKNDLKKNFKKFHTLPAKKQKGKGSCLVEQTVIIPSGKISLPTIPPPLVSKISQNSTLLSGKISDKFFYNCITNYAGTATMTVTSMTVVPVPTTHLTVKTETIFAPATELLTEVLYTPYTVTTTATNTMYMIKVTTVNGAGCKNCELDSNGMVLPAGQLPPGIFATPINEVDPNKFDIVGYAGMNPPNFNPHLQGFKAQNTM